MIIDKNISKKIYETYYLKVYSYAMTLAADKHLAEDIAQETFLKAMTTKSSFKGDSDIFSWLCAIAKNLYYDHLRKNQKLSAEEIPDKPDDKTDVACKVASTDLAIRIHRELHKLEEPYKEVFNLRVFGELSFSEIASIFGKTESWARVTYHRAKLKLEERMSGV